jgi:glutathione S-transferase
LRSPFALAHPVESNAVFVRMSEAAHAQLNALGWACYRFDDGSVRFVCSWATQEAAVDGIIDAAVLMAYEVRLRPEDRQFTPWIDAQWSKITRALDMFETAPLSGDFDMPQIALACALSYLDFRHDARGWRNGRPNLAAWYQTQSARQSMVLTAQPVT